MKPIKKTNQSAGWNRKTSLSKSAIGSRNIAKKFLIVCEGQTEEIYFKSFPILTATVKAEPTGLTKLALVKKATKLAKEDNYDEIWCVFDMDINYTDQENQRNDFNSAIKQCQETKKFKVAYSNDCFELWFYLHFTYTDQQNHRTFYYKKLREFWNINYEEKGKELGFCKTIYSKLQEKNCSQEEAIKRAEKLFNSKVHNLPCYQNPVTTVYELVRELNKYLKY
ncbi:MAG: RloB family protein [Arcicella sp.]|nr:RloB family protein [Arcicella sp.]